MTSRFGPLGPAELTKVVNEHAPALAPLLMANPGLGLQVLERPLERDDNQVSIQRELADLAHGLSDGPEFRRLLRRFRHKMILRIALREVLQRADIDQTSAEMSALASSIVSCALDRSMQTVAREHGSPLNEQGKLVPFVVLGMGKLGGNELNLGSDIDLCFFYETDEAPQTDRGLSIHEFYARVVTRTVQMLTQVTEDGFCFRVDLRLRPEGSQGPLVNSLPSAERYYESWGQTWERAALLRARPIAGDATFGQALLQALTPFVFRRTINPKIADDMADMLRKSRRELEVNDLLNIKLGEGGIREAEFFVQTLQLIWGGQKPELRVANTIQALHRLRASGLVSDGETTSFESAWALLRRIEHRIHVRAGYQTHDLPSTFEERTQLSLSLGYHRIDNFDRAVVEARMCIKRLFASLDPGSHPEPEDPNLERLCDRIEKGAFSEIASGLGALLHVHDVDAAIAHLRRLSRTASTPLSSIGRQRVPGFATQLLREIRLGANPDHALQFAADFFARVGASWGYDRLLSENPTLLRRLISLFSTSPTLSSALIAHPEALDRIVAAASVPSLDSISEVYLEPTFVQGPDRIDVESFVHALRRTKLETTLQVGLAYASRELALGQCVALLSELACRQIECAFRYAEREYTLRTQDLVPPLVVIAMGKLGSKELGFGGDLDLLFLFDTPSDTAETAATWIAQRTLRLLSQPDSEGPGYRTDTRLRPSGSHGLLVASLESFKRYHETHGEPWERQALLRARQISGEANLSEKCAALFNHLAYERGAPSPSEIVHMRKRIEQELGQTKPSQYDLKYGYGGILDIEFFTQWLQMKHGNDLSVRHRAPLDALNALHVEGFLSLPDMEAMTQAYRWFRELEQNLRLLDETRNTIPSDGPLAEALARRAGIRERDGQGLADVLRASVRRYAEEVRGIFERTLGAISSKPPWQKPTL